MRERKCILCQIVYSSKKEMDEHIRSMLHHRELENLRGRDSSHECRVCRVTVVGLSTYAKHISSQLHKDNVDALEIGEDKEEVEEEYFDKELIQLINQRKEQSRPDEPCSSSKEQETDNYPRRREDRLSYQETGQQEWHRDPSERNWQWHNECFNNPRPGFLHPTLNHNSNWHLGSSRGGTGWHLNSPSNRHLIHVNVGGTWHSNAGGATSWHQRGSGRNFHWHQEGKVTFPNQHPRNCGGNWKMNPYNGNQWNYGPNVETFPQGRNRPPRHCDTAQEQESGWSNTNCPPNTFCKERFKWKKTENKTSNGTLFANSDKTSSDRTNDFTSDKHIEDNFIGFKMSSNSDLSSKTKPVICPEKNNSLSRDKPHRWSPYPSQKIAESPQAIPQSSDKDVPIQLEETKIGYLQPDQDERLASLRVAGDKDLLDFCAEQSEEKKIDHSELKSPRMPSLKCPLRSIPDMKLSTLKRDQKNPLKGVKLQFPTTFGDRQNRLSALNLETIKSNSYISKLRSASKQIKVNLETQESSNKEPIETLGEVLRKAKEMLRNSQALQNPHIQSLSDTSSPHIQSLSDTSSNPNTGRAEVFQDSFETSISFDDTLEDVSDDDFFNNGAKIDNTVESKNSDANCKLEEDRSTKHLEQIFTNSETVLFTEKFADKCFPSQTNPESPDSEDDRNPHLSQDFHDVESFENVSDLEMQKGATHSSNPILPELSKLGLPVSLQRDLTRHISLRSKTGAHLPEPNLNSARRIRNVSGHRKSETDKDSSLKPTLRQILNASRRNINWEQVIQHVTKKKQELGKGLPRFGIEMVAQVQSEQEGLDFEEADLEIESYHWDGIALGALGSIRKRSLSESSVAVDKASVYNIFKDHISETCCEQPTNIPKCQPTPAAPGPKVVSTVMQSAKQEDVPAIPPSVDTDVLNNQVSAETSQSQDEGVEACAASDSLCMFQRACEDMVLSAHTAASAHVDGGTDSCGSGTEQNDSQGVGKKRRATGDGSCPETSNLERNTKRRKIRGIKERSQVDQLLNISLREEELNTSLLGVDNHLLQARATLQAAYLEVQRLLVLKQQITMEMSAMRTQRIQILQGLQGTYEPANEVEEGTTSGTPPQTPVVTPGHLISFLLEPPAYLSPQTQPPSTLLPAPVPVYTPPAIHPALAIPDSSVTIKQEPVSPVRIEENMVIPPPSETNGESSQNTSVYPIITATMSLSELTSTFPVISGDQSLDKPSVSTASSQTFFSTPKSESDSPGNRPVSVQSPLQGHTLPFSMSPKETSCSTGPAEHAESTLITIESKIGKKKKLRKKKTLRPTHIPENSDTEQDISSKPVRKVKCRRLSKETTVSTSTSVELEIDTASQETEMNKEDSDSSIEVMEIPNPRFEVVHIDSHSDNEKPDSPSKTELAGVVCSSQGSLETNDEVTSTSELGTNYVVENVVSMASERRASNQTTKNSSVSSETGEDEEPTEGNFEGHQASVNAIQIFDGMLYTCSADKSVRVYNLVNRQCEGVFEGHTSKVNCLLVTQTYGKNAVLFTGSSDHTIRCYSITSRECIETLDLGERVLCLHVRWKILYAGLANGTVVTFSTKNNKQIDVFECHGPRAVSCMATAQEGARRLLLVGSYDCTISVRDARNGLLLRTLEGHTKTVLCMKVVNDLVFSGSSDQSVHAHNIHTGELVRIYKGHNHAVTVVNILGKVMVTACLDKFVRVYELQSHDRLQVYGGHSDMIMCMAIHKSMIYTGCYDGSVQAVRLNLIQNYRCWWHGCSLIFGVIDHLKQHLLTDHTNPNFQTLKCRWKNCDAFFTARRVSKQDAMGHIERHAEEDSHITA
ncbi:zinc finger protein 106 isoform X2 [Mixophyes fleayi]|uniref:zinc finger protein 106 isoform X2 n=1 Tax=Mixophyes fleayi TaxID=3061075 RepID=UPI003F4E4191